MLEQILIQAAANTYTNTTYKPNTCKYAKKYKQVQTTFVRTASNAFNMKCLELQSLI